MQTTKRAIAFVEWLLVIPGALFMTALFMRNIQPAPYEPAQSARRLVDWFAARPFLCLQIFLMALPLAAFLIGGVTVVQTWRRDTALRQACRQIFAIARAHAVPLLIAGATLVAGGILAIVAVHQIAG